MVKLKNIIQKYINKTKTVFSYSQDTFIKNRSVFVIKGRLVEVQWKPVLKAPFIDVTHICIHTGALCFTCYLIVLIIAQKKKITTASFAINPQ